MSEDQKKKRNPWSNVGEEEFYNSNLGVYAEWDEVTGLWTWKVAPGGTIELEVLNTVVNKEPVDDLAAIVLKKKGPAVVPWVVLVEVSSRTIVHLFIALTPGLIDETMSHVIVHNQKKSQRVADELALSVHQAYRKLHSE